MVDNLTTATVRVDVDGEENLVRLNDAFKQLDKDITETVKNIGEAKLPSTPGFNVKGFFGEITGSIWDAIGDIRGPIGSVVGEFASVGHEVTAFGGKLVGLTTEFGLAGTALGIFLGGLAGLVTQFNLMGKSIGWADKAGEGAVRTYSQMVRFGQGGDFAEAQRRIKVGEELLGGRYETMQARLTKLFSEKNIEGGAKGTGPLVERFERLGIAWQDLQTGPPMDPLAWLQKFVEQRDDIQKAAAQLPLGSAERRQADHNLTQFFEDVEYIGGRIFGPVFQRRIRTLTPERIESMLDSFQALQEAYGAPLDQAAVEGRVRAAEDWETAQWNLSNAMGRVGTSIGNKVMPALTDVFNELTERVNEIGPAMANLGAVFISAGWQTILETMKAVDLTKWGELFKDIAGVSAPDAQGVGQSIAQMFSDLPDHLRTAASAVQELVAALGGLVNIVQWASNPLGKTSQELTKFGDQIADNAEGAGKATGVLAKAAGAVAQAASYSGFGLAQRAWAAGADIVAPPTALAGPPPPLDVAPSSIEALRSALAAEPAIVPDWEAAAGNLQTGVETGGLTAAQSLEASLMGGGDLLAAGLTSGADAASATIQAGFANGASQFAGVGTQIGSEAAAAFRNGVAGLSIAGPSVVGATATAAPARTGLDTP